ncbi:MAG: hypothetical protein JST12_02030 [Armatimonadetes bacterium]|nr:hypothetical protein [Armatimonadota bacterium]
MKPQTTEDREKMRHLAVGGGLIGGVVLFLCGGVITWMLAISSVFTATATRNPNTGAVTDMGEGVHIPWGVLVMALGLIIAVMSVIYGLVNARSPGKGTRMTFANMTVIARFATDGTGVLYIEQSQIEFLDDPKYYVRLSGATEGSMEYQCVEEVFWMCGEGLKGEADIQGRWLGAFRPYQVPHVPVV